MKRKYILYNTAKPAIFLFYALVTLLLFLLSATVTQDIQRDHFIGGIFCYLLAVLIFSVGIDRPKRGLSL